MTLAFATLLGLIQTYRYVIIFPLAVVEGPFIMTICGFLLRLGFFDFWPLYLILMTGDLAADIVWYGVGYYGGRPFVERYGHYVSITPELIDKTEDAFHRHQNKILFLSKITMGFGFALVVLMTAGLARIPFRKYVIFNALGQLIWTALLMGVGFFFGNLYVTVNEGLRVVSLVAFIAIFLALIYGASRYLRRKDIQNLL
ncbi:MAG TPA: DedA family protein [Candidatus Paceibacterota bacterium]|nr:DedA family protein [Candidatus Paceibacterota bacterium]